MIKVLHVVDRFSYNSGVSSIILNYYEHINREEICFDFLTHSDTDDELKKRLTKDGSQIYRFPDFSAKNMMSYQKKLDVFFEDAKYDIVHGHIPIAACFYLKSAKNHGIKTRILHSHNSRAADGAIKKMRNRILIVLGRKYATNYFACSKLAARFCFPNAKQVYIMNNAIELDKFGYSEQKRIAMRKRLDLTTEMLIGHIGRMSPQKNHGFLLKIFKEVKTLKPDSKLLILGDGELKGFVLSEIKALGLERDIIYEGVKKNTDEYYQAMDVFVLPSLYEGLPVVGVEAQAAGLPCIFSDTVTKEVKLTDETAFCSLSEAPDRWARLIIDVYSYHKRRKKVESVQKNGYSINVEADKLLDNYKKLIDREVDAKT